jgi:GxxExxY protein
MRFKPEDYPHSELTGRIIGAAMAVHRELGPGLDEKIYENSLCIELAEQQIHFTQQQAFPVHYRGRYVGKLVTDLIVDEKVIVETKVVDPIIDVHIAQLLSYLSVTHLKVGVILNFKPASLGVKRVANVYLNHQSISAISGSHDPLAQDSIPCE